MRELQGELERLDADLFVAHAAGFSSGFGTSAT